MSEHGFETRREPGTGIEHYWQEVSTMGSEVLAAQRPLLVELAGRMAQTVMQDRRIFIFGTGHSHMMAEEAFFRAGGLAAAVPILSGELMLHENPFLSSRLERTPGLAAPLLDQYQPQEGEMLFIFSNSGVNQLPVEMAIEGRLRGLVVVGVCSRAYASVAPISRIGKRLEDIADYCLDNGGVPGDAVIPVGLTGWRTGATSTILGALLWNCLLSETLLLLNELGAELPVIASFNMPGADAHNQTVLAKWSQKNPYLRAWYKANLGG